MINYAKAINIKLPDSKDTKFADNDKIQSFTKEAVAIMKEMKLLKEK